MLRHLVPGKIRAPFARYSHAVEIPVSARLLLCSGQLGISAGDQVPESAVARMCFADIVRLNAYVTDRAHMAPYMAVRDRYVGSPPPASTLMIVTGFTRVEFKVEVEALAAKVD